jgi:hypothetical protein
MSTITSIVPTPVKIAKGFILTLSIPLMFVLNEIDPEVESTVDNRSQVSIDNV